MKCNQIAMPTLIRQDGFDVRMYFDDHDPPHVHVFKAGGQAKITIDEKWEEYHG